MAASNPKVDRMRTVKFFADASDKAMETLSRAADEVSVDAGKVLITEGLFHQEAYVIESGEAEVLVGDDIVATIGEGEMVGEVSFFCRGTATATVRAKTQMNIIAIPYNRIDAVLEENPKMLRAIAEELAGRLRDMDARHH